MAFDLTDFPAEQRLWGRLRETKRGCWEWTGHTTSNGYGRLKFQGGIESTHRLAYRLAVGAVPAGMYVCHHCDNKICCNPAHLYAGTPKENTHDAIERGLFPMGTAQWKAKLTEADVVEIRKLLSTVPNQEIAARFGVNAGSISAIRHGHTWRSVGVPEYVPPPTRRLRTCKRGHPLTDDNYYRSGNQGGCKRCRRESATRRRRQQGAKPISRLDFPLERAKELYEAGLSLKEVGQHLEVSETLVYKRFKEAGVPRRPAVKYRRRK